MRHLHALDGKILAEQPITFEEMKYSTAKSAKMHQKKTMSFVSRLKSWVNRKIVDFYFDS